MARYIDDRSNDTLFVDGSLESLLPQTSVARTLWAGLVALDFKGFDDAYRNDESGRPAIDPMRLVGVWLLALLRGVTSSVELARRCGEDIELRWLLGGAAVEKSTLCTFRTERLDTLKALSTRVLSCLAHANLLPGEQMAVDGSVIRAAASCKASVPRKNLKRRIEKLGEVIESKLLEDTPKDSVDALERQKERLEKSLEKMDSLGKRDDKDRITVTEHEASRKRLKNGSYAPAHNVQVVADMSSGAIVHTEVIEQGNDCGQLVPQFENARLELERVSAQLGDGESSKPASPSTVCADSAYHDTRQLVALDEQGVDTVVPDDARQNRQPPGVTKEYRAEAFDYDEERDEMRCPKGKPLKPRKLNNNKTAMTYQAKASECQQCPAKSQCCPKAKQGRSVNRPLYADLLDEVAQRVSSPEGQQCMRSRRITVEGAFARILHHLSWRRCRTWGKAGVQAEALWRQITHNLLLLTRHWQPIMPQETANG